MAGKVIDIDPNQRLSKESLQYIKDYVGGLDVKDLESLVVIALPKESTPAVICYGLTFEIIGLTKAVLDNFSQDLLLKYFHKVNGPKDKH